MKATCVSIDTSGPDPETHAIVRIRASVVELHSVETIEDLDLRIKFRQEMAEQDSLVAAGFSVETWGDAIAPKVAAGQLSSLTSRSLIEGSDKGRLVVYDVDDEVFLSHWYRRLELDFPYHLPAMSVVQLGMWQHELFPKYVQPKDWTLQGLVNHFSAELGPKLVGADARHDAMLSILGALKSMGN